MSVSPEIQKRLARPTRFSGSAKPLPTPIIDAIERGYAAHVATCLHGQILRYSNRLALLQAADRLHINRFRANLIIAMVQHERGDAAVTEPEQSRFRIGALSTASMLAMVMLAEVLVITALWWQLARAG
jgi:hypothetical protein